MAPLNIGVSILEALADEFVKALHLSASSSLFASILRRIHQSKKLKATVLVLSLLLATFMAGSIAFHTTHAYIPMLALGVFYGMILSYPATKFLSPKLQSALAGMLGGISLGNVSSKVASARSAILALSKQISDTVQQLAGAIPGSNAMSPYIEAGICFCVWTTLITVFLMVVVQAYLGEDIKSSAPDAALPPPPANPARGAAAIP